MSDQEYYQLIRCVKKSIQEDDLESAQKIAQFLVDYYPDQFEGLLLMAGLSSPGESQVYLQKAKALNPNHPLVKKALSWAASHQGQGDKGNKGTQSGLSPADDKGISIAKKAVAEKRRRLWILALVVIDALIIFFLILGVLPRNPNHVNNQFGLLQSTKMTKPTLSATPDIETVNISATNDVNATLAVSLTPTNSPTPTLTPTIIPDLYGCEMELRFLSGPLEGEGTTFSMLDRSYFQDKGDKFDPGKQTGIFYENQRFLLLHSGYLGGNPLYPLESEFIRKYLELWGNNDSSYIEDQIQSLIGSEMVWSCKDQKTINLQLSEIIRLSHTATNQLWLDPANLLTIIENREGEPSEWIGAINNPTQRSIYFGFCGWGPPEIAQNRSIYYRYVFRFDIMD